jgi:hypothetical protein
MGDLIKRIWNKIMIWNINRGKKRPKWGLGDKIKSEFGR